MHIHVYIYHLRAIIMHKYIYSRASYCDRISYTCAYTNVHLFHIDLFSLLPGDVCDVQVAVWSAGGDHGVVVHPHRRRVLYLSPVSTRRTPPRGTRDAMSWNN